MKGFFDVDGKFYTVMSKAADLLIVTVLWILGCLPVVTILTSTASMYYVVVKCVRYDNGTVFAEFKEAYRNNLRQGIGLTLLYGGIGAVIGFLDYRVFFAGSGRSFLAAVGMLVLSIVYLLNLLWIAPVFSRFSNTLGNLVKLNYVIAVRNILRSIPMLLGMALAVLLFLAVNESVFVLPSVAALLCSYLSEPALWRYMPKQEQSGDWRYGCR